MQIKQKTKDAVEICCVIGEININTVAELKRVFKKLIAAKSRKALLNFKDLDYIDSTGLACLIQFSKDLKKMQGVVFLSDLSPKVSSLFAITKLSDAFRIYETEEKAIEDSLGY